MSLSPEIIRERFKPDLTPEQMKRLGVLSRQYFDKDPGENNYFKVDASLKEWPGKWIDKDTAPMGWFDWYQGYSSGKQSPDDLRQMARWYSFKQRHMGQLMKADPSLKDMSIQPRRRQALLNWGIAPGIEIEKISEMSTNKYLDKIASLKGLGKALKETGPLERLGLGMSATGLGFGATNLGMSINRNNRDNKKFGLEERSLETLKGIHKTLESKPSV